MGLSHLTAEELARFVAESCSAQGVPIKVTDIAVVRQVTALLGGAPADPRARARSAGARTAGAPSQSPDGLNTAGVEALGASNAGTDDSVVEQCPDDSVLTLQSERVPLGA